MTHPPEYVWPAGSQRTCANCSQRCLVPWIQIHSVPFPGMWKPVDLCSPECLAIWSQMWRENISQAEDAQSLTLLKKVERMP